jgi:integrase
MAVRRYRFTQREIEALGVGKHSDGAGLYLYKGTKYSNWVYRFTILGKRQEMGLGGYPAMTLKQARIDADRHASVLGSGHNPKDARDDMRAAEQVSMTANSPETLEAGRLRTIAPLAFDARKAELRGDGEAGRWYSPLRTHVLPTLGGSHVSEIDGPAIAKALRPIWRAKPDVARKAITRLSICLKHARSRGFKVDRDAIDDAREILGKQMHVTKHIPSMPWRDIPAFYATLGTSTVELALSLLILTAVRSRPLRFAHASQFEGNIWTIPPDLMKGQKGKTSEFKIPLASDSRQRVAIAIAGGRDSYLFPGVRKGVISDMSMTALMKRAGLDARPHGFRASFRTWADEWHDEDKDESEDEKARKRFPFEVKEMALSHGVGGITERSYARSGFEGMRGDLMGQWGAFVTSESRDTRLSNGNILHSKR